jgi:hypothetical protein
MDAVERCGGLDLSGDADADVLFEAIGPWLSGSFSFVPSLMVPGPRYVKKEFTVKTGTVYRQRKRQPKEDWLMVVAISFILASSSNRITPCCRTDISVRHCLPPSKFENSKIVVTI